MRSIDELEALEKKLYKSFASMPNCPERERLSKKWKAVYDEITLREVINKPK